MCIIKADCDCENRKIALQKINITDDAIITFLRENLSAISDDGISNKLHARKNEANVRPIASGEIPDSEMNGENIPTIGADIKRYRYKKITETMRNI